MFFTAFVLRILKLFKRKTEGQTFQLLSIILIQQTLVAANAVLVLNDFFYRHVVFLIVF